MDLDVCRARRNNTLDINSICTGIPLVDTEEASRIALRRVTCFDASAYYLLYRRLSHGKRTVHKRREHFIAPEHLQMLWVRSKTSRRRRINRSEICHFSSPSFLCTQLINWYGIMNFSNHITESDPKWYLNMNELSNPNQFKLNWTLDNISFANLLIYGSFILRSKSHPAQKK